MAQSRNEKQRRTQWIDEWRASLEEQLAELRTKQEADNTLEVRQKIAVTIAVGHLLTDLALNRISKAQFSEALEKQMGLAKAIKHSNTLRNLGASVGLVTSGTYDLLELMLKDLNKFPAVQATISHSSAASSNGATHSTLISVADQKPDTPPSAPATQESLAQRCLRELQEIVDSNVELLGPKDPRSVQLRELHGRLTNRLTIRDVSTPAKLETQLDLFIDSFVEPILEAEKDTKPELKSFAVFYKQGLQDFMRDVGMIPPPPPAEAPSNQAPPVPRAPHT